MVLLLSLEMKVMICTQWAHIRCKDNWAIPSTAILRATMKTEISRMLFFLPYKHLGWLANNDSSQSSAQLSNEGLIHLPATFSVR